MAGEADVPDDRPAARRRHARAQPPGPRGLRQQAVPRARRRTPRRRAAHPRPLPARPAGDRLGESAHSPRDPGPRPRRAQRRRGGRGAAGISLDRVERYAGPVLAERAHVVEQAQAAPARRATAGTAPALAELVDARLAEQKVATDSVTWDAWRGDDDRWTVRLELPRRRPAAGGQLGLRPARPGAGRVRRRGPLAGRRHRRRAALRRPARGSPPAGGGAARRRCRDGVDERDETHLRLPRRRGLRPGGRRGAAGGRARRAAASRCRQAASASRGRRQPVPSWDDIMFGPRKRD